MMRWKARSREQSILKTARLRKKFNPDFKQLIFRLDEVWPHVAERGKASPPIDERLQFQSRLDPALLTAGVGQRAAVRVVNMAAPGMIMLRVMATADRILNLIL